MANKKPAVKKAATQEPITDGLPEVVATKPVVETPKKSTKPKWEIKDRLYYLVGRHTPLTLTIPGKHTRKHALLYFDEETGEVNIMKGRVRLCPYYFIDANRKTKLGGVLATIVPSDKKKIHGMKDGILVPCRVEE